MDDMIAWVIGVPVFLMLLVLALERLEANVVAPVDRAATIAGLVELTPDLDELERRVAAVDPAPSSPNMRRVS